MPATVSPGTPLATALSSAVQPKLVEMGWSPGGEDSALTEYVILMLANGKTQGQIADELSNDLLNLGEGDTQALDFSKWLFEQVETLNNNLNKKPSTTPSQATSIQAIPSFMSPEVPGPETAASGPSQLDTDVGDGQGDSVYVPLSSATQPGGKTHQPTPHSPTGPRAMRNNRQGGRSRLLGQINKTMDRASDPLLHRVRIQPGAGRVNSHPRDLPKGPRTQHGGSRMVLARPMGGMVPGMHGGQMHGGGGQMHGGQMHSNSSPVGLMQMSPQNQMQLMAILEEQARMMAQLMPGMIPPAVNPAFQSPSPQLPLPQQSRSLFDRVEQPQRQGGSFPRRESENGISVKSHNDEAAPDGNLDTEPDHALKDDEHGEPNPDSVCKFNLRCTKKDCLFAHQSPAAPEGTLVDVTDRCPFGAACKNKKCTGRHPSPAAKVSHQAEELCRFFPHCTNPHCSFKHPNMPLCRNGADCVVSGCKFTHVQIPCKFHPCLNRSCPYKHIEGQRGAFADKVWTAGSTDNQDKPHVSERKFIEDESAEEELIKPSTGAGNSHGSELVT